MTLDQFFERLPRKGWALDGSRIIRKRRIDGYSVCPITTCMTPRLPAMYYESAAKHLGIKPFLMADIVAAADCFDDLSANQKALRARLLAHCGLSEVQQ